MSKKKKRFYAVVHGRQPGVYTQWFGDDGAAAQVEGFADAVYKGFYTEEEMAAWLRGLGRKRVEALAPNLLELLDLAVPGTGKSPPEPDKVVIYTDGSALQNPGPGGYGVVVQLGGKRQELSGGFRRTTNNRMELLACIEGLKALKKPSDVVLYSDSSYVVNGMKKGWVARWRRNGWRLQSGNPVKNEDLWRALAELDDFHQVEFRWVRGHAGNPENERCDRLAVEAAQGRRLGVDERFESGPEEPPRLF